MDSVTSDDGTKMPTLGRTRSRAGRSNLSIDPGSNQSSLSEKEKVRRVCMSLLENFVTKQEEFDQFQ